MSKDVKWIRLDIDMFSNPKIKKLRRLPDGNNLLLIWVMLLTMAGRCNAGGMIFITQDIPYTLEDLADELGFSIDTVKLAIGALENLGMVTTNENTFCIPGWYEHQNEAILSTIREHEKERKSQYRTDNKKRIEQSKKVSRKCPGQKTGLSLSLSLNNNNSIKEIIDYLNTILGTKYTYKCESNNKHIRARLSEGHTVEDFKKVIDNKYASWKNDEKMSKYLRPETLFSSKFESYLNEKAATKDGTKRYDDATEAYGNIKPEYTELPFVQ